MTPKQSAPATNPWLDPQPSTPINQHPRMWNPWLDPQPSTQLNQHPRPWNPWTDPPITAPSSNASHHYVYQPVTRSGNSHFHQSAPSPNASHHYVYQPVTRSGTAHFQQPVVRDPCKNPPASILSTLNLYRRSHLAVRNSCAAGGGTTTISQLPINLVRTLSSMTVPSCIPSCSASHLLSSKGVFQLTSFSQTSPHPMYYPGRSQGQHIQFYSTQPAAEPAGLSIYQGLTTQHVNGIDIYDPANLGGFNHVQLVPRRPSPNDLFWVYELDGSWTEQTLTTIINSRTPGQISKSSKGFPIWICRPKN